MENSLHCMMRPMPHYVEQAGSGRMVGMAVPTTVDSIEARNRLNMIPMVTRMLRLRDIESFQGKTSKGLAIIPQNKIRDWPLPIPDLV